MFKVTRVMLFLIGFLSQAFAQADDDNSIDWALATTATFADASLAPAYVQSTQTQGPSSSIEKLHFQDSSAVGRASRLRSLSLLTLAQFRQSRLFLGVNDRGILGLHFNAAKRGDERCLEVARMPYLRDTPSE